MAKKVLINPSTGPERSKRHALTCGVPKSPNAYPWQWREVEATPDIMADYEPCRVCGGS